uniref:PUB 62/63 C-terminal domain-containing protein n=1 Tax=Ananas comosus var. bracteatus TaxID=296719 RepID=A0A6V7QHG7_ANACO|nr:unnamed protein product [Ananas comosus var. bracteatus]
MNVHRPRRRRRCRFPPLPLSIAASSGGCAAAAPVSPPSSLSLGLVPLHTPPAPHPSAGACGGARAAAAAAAAASGEGEARRHRAVRGGARWGLPAGGGGALGVADAPQRRGDRARGDDAVVVRCALESARMYFRARAQCGGDVGSAKPGRGVYIYRAGRSLEDGDLSPPCMSDTFRSLGKAARAALCAIARHLRLRSDVFNHLLDDTHCLLMRSHRPVAGAKSSSTEVEKGLLTLIASDCPGVQVCDPNGRWYLADGGDSPGDLLLLTGKALSHATAGLRPATSYRTVADHLPLCMTSGRASLTFRLLPQANAILDCSPISAAGHVIPQSYQPISVSQFMDDLSAEEDVICNHPENTYEAQNNLIREPSLRSVLSDPLSCHGCLLWHSFGGHMLKQVIDKARCSLCHAEIEADSLIPNYALRAAAVAVKMEDDRRLFHNAALRKRRKEAGEQMDALKRLSKENGEVAADADSHRQLKGVQYPFAVSEKVLIKGNRRTPDKFVGREAVITSQCLNGWYLLKILDSGESVRLQYRSLQKLSGPQSVERSQPQLLLQTSS